LKIYNAKKRDEAIHDGIIDFILVSFVFARREGIAGFFE